MAHQARESTASPAVTAPESTTTETSGTTLADPSYAQVAAEDSTPNSPQRSSTTDGAGDSPSHPQRDSRIPSPTVSTTSGRTPQRRRGSTASNLSIESPRDGKGRGGGIKLGTAKPVGGVVTGTAGAGDMTPSSGDEAARPRQGR